MDNDLVESLIKTSLSYNDVSVKLFGFSNGKTLSKLRAFVFNHSIDTSHFDSHKTQRKYEIVEKDCPICGKKFKTKLNHKREKTTCSHACSNTHFRSGEDNGGYKTTEELVGEAKYVRICFDTHKKECVVCGEINIVAVHHYDSNHDNNEISNLIPMCPTHHLYMHSKYKKLVIDKVDEFRNSFIKEHTRVA